MLSRRSLLASSAVLLGCRPPKATGYSGYCFVANQDGHSLAVVDLTTFRLWKPIALDGAPSQVLPHPHQAEVFALAADTGVIYRIDVSTLSVMRRLRAGNRAVSMRLAPRGDALWVLFREPAMLVELALDTLESRRRIGLPAAGDDFDISPDGRAAIASSGAGAIFIASLDRAVIERSVALATQPGIIRFQQKGAQIVAGSPADRCLVMVDSASGRLIVRLPVPVQPQHFCFSTDEGQLFVTGEGKDAVVIAYPYQTEIGETILAGRAPAAMAAVGPYLLVANPETNSVTVLDINYRKLAAVVQVGQEPREIIITPDDQYALVINQKSGDLAVIRIAALTLQTRVRRFKSAPLFTLIPVGQKPVSAAVVSLT